jgi:uncharacterized integral membrane protein
MIGRQRGRRRRSIGSRCGIGFEGMAMKKLVVRLILLPILLVVAVFAIVNRAPVELSLWPLPWDARAPLFIVLLASLLLGVLIGAALVWGGARRQRSAARENRRANERLQRQIDRIKSQPPATPRATPPAVVLPPAGAASIVPPEHVSGYSAGHGPERAGHPPPSFTPVQRLR